MLADGLDQDPLPGMPKPGARKPRTVKAKPTWARIRQPKTKRPTFCQECALQAADGAIPTSQVLVAVWRRTINGLRAGYCSPHADPLRKIDGDKRRDDDREKRAWRKRK